MLPSPATRQEETTWLQVLQTERLCRNNGEAGKQDLKGTTLGKAKAGSLVRPGSALVHVTEGGQGAGF